MSEVREPVKKTSKKTKQRIIEKGFELICKEGYHNITCADITLKIPRILPRSQKTKTPQIRNPDRLLPSRHQATAQTHQTMANAKIPQQSLKRLQMRPQIPQKPRRLWLKAPKAHQTRGEIEK